MPSTPLRAAIGVTNGPATTSPRALRVRRSATRSVLELPAPSARADRGHDYRELCATFAHRMSAMRSVDEVSLELATYLTRTCSATSVAVYLERPGQLSTYALSAGVGTNAFPALIGPTPGLAAWLDGATAPLTPPSAIGELLGVSAQEGVVAAALRWQASALGFILLGPPRGGVERGPDDLAFLASVADLAAPWVAALRRPEAPASLVHDIKNSVSSLSLLVRNAASHMADPEFQRDALATVSRAVDRMRRLLVQLTTPVSRPVQSMREPIDLRALIVEATAPLASGRQVRLVRTLEAVDVVYGDREALLRVIENLTTNAAEAIDAEGTVTVTLAQQQGHAVISVADTGCGISQDYLEQHLFAPFASTKTGGWGVGLYQTKQVVESQCGEILVESAVGRGTTFTVKLPLRADVPTSSVERAR
jgi:signal transduction histidine kinase